MTLLVLAQALVLPGTLKIVGSTSTIQLAGIFGIFKALVFLFPRTVFKILFSKYGDSTSVMNCSTMHRLYTLHLQKLDFLRPTLTILCFFSRP